MKIKKYAIISTIILSSFLLSSCSFSDKRVVAKMNKTFKDDHFTYDGSSFNLEGGYKGYVRSEKYPKKTIIIRDGQTNYNQVRYEDDAQEYFEDLVEGYFDADKIEVNFIYYIEYTDVEDMDFDEFFEEHHKGTIDIDLYYKGDLPSEDEIKDSLIEIAEDSEYGFTMHFDLHKGKKNKDISQNYILYMDKDDHIKHIYLDDHEDDDNDRYLVEDMDLDK